MEYELIFSEVSSKGFLPTKIRKVFRPHLNPLLKGEEVACSQILPKAFERNTIGEEIPF